MTGVADITAIDGIGPAVVAALRDFFHEPHNVDVWDDLLREVDPRRVTRSKRWTARLRARWWYLPESWKP